VAQHGQVKVLCGVLEQPGSARSGAAVAEGGRAGAAQNRKNTSERLELKKYNKYMKKHTVHREIK